MRADSAIALTRMRPNGGQPAAKPRQETGVFNRIQASSITYTPWSCNLTSCGGVATNHGQNGGIVVRNLNVMRQHLAFARRHDGKRTGQ
jgi:hypothetical protein